MRTTNDVDLIVKNDKGIFMKFLKELQKYDFDVDEEQAGYAISENFNFTVFDNITPYRLDIKLAKQKNDVLVLETAETQVYRNIELKIATVEWVLYGKIAYLGFIDDLTDDRILNLDDALDFITVWNNNKDIIDKKWLEEKCEDENLNSTLQKMLEVIEHLKKD